MSNRFSYEAPPAKAPTGVAFTAPRVEVPPWANLRVRPSLVTQQPPQVSVNPSPITPKTPRPFVSSLPTNPKDLKRAPSLNFRKTLVANASTSLLSADTSEKPPSLPRSNTFSSSPSPPNPPTPPRNISPKPALSRTRSRSDANLNQATDEIRSKHKPSASVNPTSNSQTFNTSAVEDIGDDEELVQGSSRRRGFSNNGPRPLADPPVAPAPLTSILRRPSMDNVVETSVLAVPEPEVVRITSQTFENPRPVPVPKPKAAITATFIPLALADERLIKTSATVIPLALADERLMAKSPIKFPALGDPTVSDIDSDSPSHYMNEISPPATPSIVSPINPQDILQEQDQEPDENQPAKIESPVENTSDAKILPPIPLEPEPLKLKFKLRQDYNDAVAQPSTTSPPPAPLTRKRSVTFQTPQVHSRSSSTTSPTKSFAPRSLTSHLQTSGPSPRKLYLATHTAFHRFASQQKLPPAILSKYITRERLYLQTTLRYLSLLLASIHLPRKLSGLVNKRVGGVRERAKDEIDRMEKERKDKAHQSQKDFGPGMGANLGIEIASGVAGMGMGMVLGGLVGIGTNVGLKTATGAAGVGMNSLGNMGQDEPETENKIVEVIENVHKDVGERTMDWIVGAIVRTRATLSLFEEICEDIPTLNAESWEGDDGVSEAGGMFGRLLESIGNAVERKERSVLEALVILWARERAHLEAWSSIKAALSTRGPLTKLGPDQGAVHFYLLPHFTSEDSLSSVDALTRILDDLWTDRYLSRSSSFKERRDEGKASKKRGLANGKSGEWESDIKDLEEMWEMVLDIQARFWPER